MISTKRFANTESPISLESFEEVGEKNALVLKNHRGEDVFIGAQEAVDHMLHHGMKDPFTAGATRYSEANANLLRQDARTGDALASLALSKALQASEAHATGDLPAARKLVAAALELSPKQFEALQLQDFLSAEGAVASHNLATADFESPNRAAAARGSATAGASFFRRLLGGGRRQAQQAGSDALARAARQSGIAPADLRALGTLALALSNDRSDGYVDSGLAVGNYIRQAAGYTPERLAAIDAAIRINGEPFSHALYAVFDSTRRVGGRRMGPDTLGSLLSSHLQAFGLPAMPAPR